MSRHQNAGTNDHLTTAHKSFENVAKFKHLEMTITNQNCIQEGVNSRLNSVNVKIYRTMISLLALYGCETSSLTLREEYRLRVVGNRVLREYLDLRGRRGREAAGDCKMRSFITCTLHQMLLW
jgi:hypothetical protein